MEQIKPKKLLSSKYLNAVKKIVKKYWRETKTVRCKSMLVLWNND